MKKEADILFNRFAQIIDEGNVGFFFGAGMSRNAGIPVVPTIVCAIVSSLGLPDVYTKKLIELKYPFEAFLEILNRYASLEKLLEMFKQGEPTEFHYMVKHLVEKGLVTQLMTTNFDLLIEKTGISLNNVVYDEKDFHQLSNDNVNYIKIHGGINKVGTIRTIMGSIAKKQLRAKRKDAINFFFKNAGLKTVFVFGYSCSDKLDLTPYIKSVSDCNTRIVFVNHSQSDIAIETKMDNNNPFSGFENLYVTCNTDSLIRYLEDYFHVSLTCNTSCFSVDEYLDYSSLGVYERYLFGAGLLFRNSCYEEAADLLRHALKHDGDIVRRVEMISFLFEIYHNIQMFTSKTMDEILPHNITFNKMEEEKNRSLEILNGIKENKTRDNKIAGLKMHWGHFLLSFRKYDDAIQSYRESLELLLQTANTYRIYQSRNNIANTILTRWNNGDSILNGDEVYQECYNIWRKCLLFFRQSAYPFEFEIACENMAELLLHFRKNQTKRIERYLNMAMEISVYLNDQTGINNCNKMFKQLHVFAVEKS